MRASHDPGEKPNMTHDSESLGSLVTHREKRLAGGGPVRERLGEVDLKARKVEKKSIEGIHDRTKSSWVLEGRTRAVSVSFPEEGL